MQLEFFRMVMLHGLFQQLRQDRSGYDENAVAFADCSGSA
jgi:hypothetical protein